MNYECNFLGATSGIIQSGGFMLPPPPKPGILPTSGGIITPGHMVIDKNNETVAYLPSVTVKTKEDATTKNYEDVRAQIAEAYKKARQEMEDIAITVDKVTPVSSNNEIPSDNSVLPSGPMPSEIYTEETEIKKEKNNNFLYAAIAGLTAYFILQG